MKILSSLADLRTLVGTTVAVSDWLTITQAQIDLFAQATGDHQWIHVDPVRAAQGPFGAPIAHGFLTLSLIPQFMESSLRVDGVRMGVNYGLNKVRFIAPVLVNSRLRAHFKLLEVHDIDKEGLQQTWEITIEREGSAKPVCVAESLVRQYA
ncbi:MaoC family dehydratase [Rhodoferax bucti]|uniref:MaoC family dehydratase n=1 Tax=Rhodoferax bucti TaxID=2576305 RepID=UPI0011087A87|nr:MaoC family dehydratase [Rhodoferax bucti]